MARRYSPGKYERPVHAKPIVLSTAGSASANAWWGKTTISSKASNYQMIPATAVQNNSLPWFSIGQITSVTEAVPQFVVASISPGSGFILTTAASWAMLNSYYCFYKVDVRS